jgi:hypothetical protein
MTVVKDNFFNGVKMNTNQNVHTQKTMPEEITMKSMNKHFKTGCKILWGSLMPLGHRMGWDVWRI